NQCSPPPWVPPSELPAAPAPTAESGPEFPVAPGSAQSRAQYAFCSGGNCRLALLPSYIVPVCPITVGGCALWGAGDGLPPWARAGNVAATRIIVAMAMSFIMAHSVCGEGACASRCSVCRILASSPAEAADAALPRALRMYVTP